MRVYISSGTCHYAWIDADKKEDKVRRYGVTKSTNRSIAAGSVWVGE